MRDLTAADVSVSGGYGHDHGHEREHVVSAEPVPLASAGPAGFSASLARATADLSASAESVPVASAGSAGFSASLMRAMASESLAQVTGASTNHARSFEAAVLSAVCSAGREFEISDAALGHLTCALNLAAVASRQAFEGDLKRLGALEDRARSNAARTSQSLDLIAGARAAFSRFRLLQPPVASAPAVDVHDDERQRFAASVTAARNLTNFSLPPSDDNYAAATVLGAVVMMQAAELERQRFSEAVHVAEAEARGEAKLSKLYEMLGEQSLIAAVPIDSSAAVSSAATDERIASLVASNLLLQLEATEARRTSAELSAEVRQHQESRAEELASAVEEYKANCALSVLIAVQADGLIDKRMISIMQGSAARSRAKRGGAPCNEAEKAFYTSLFVVSHDAARLVSEIFGGPESATMHAWVKQYPHVQAGLSEAAVALNVAHGISVWKKAGVDVTDGSVEVRLRHAES